jgi:uncharacterized protein YoaH (UPF0181 family)
MTALQAAKQRRIDELVAQGYSAKLATKKAAREARLRSPQHKRAMARRLAMADARFERVGEFRL